MEKLKHFFENLFFYHEPRDTYDFSLPEKNDEEASKKANQNASLIDPEEQENKQNLYDTLSVNIDFIKVKYNTLIKEAIKEIERNGQAASNRVNIDGVFISSSDKERYEDLLILEDLLKIERDEKDNPLIFEDFVIPAKDYHQFMKNGVA